MSMILKSDRLINGNTQNFLADRWTTQTFSTPAAINPFVVDDASDPRGRRGSVERHENFQLASPKGVSFLGGTFGSSPIFRTIVGRNDTVYFAPFANQVVDNTTSNFSPDSGFSGGYPFSPQHLADLKARGLNPRDLSSAPFSLGTPTIIDFVRKIADENFKGDFVAIDGKDVTPVNIKAYRQETVYLSYAQLPRYSGALFGAPDPSFFLADPDLGTNLNDTDPFNDLFPKLSDIDPSGKKDVIPFMQAGDYFAFKLNSGSHTVHFGSSPVPQDITYNILNSIKGGNGKNNLTGTRANDYIDGGKGNDRLWGGQGDDLILGGRGNDILDGGKGVDELWGDAGKDTFIFKKGYGHDTIFDLEKGDKVDIRGLTITGSISGNLLNGLTATQITFNNGNAGDQLTLVGIQPSSLNICNGFITL